MNKLVTIAIPVYKRLNTLPQALQSVAAQDYPNIELIVSDNGENGSKVKEIADQCYPDSYRFRQNPFTVNISAHYNQLLEEATGEYFVALDDDDSLSSNFVSELTRILDKNAQVVVGIAKQHVVDDAGRILRQSSDQVPEFLTGGEFIRSWTSYGYESYSTMFAKTSEMRRCRGFPDFPRGTHIDDALLIKLCLNGHVAFSTRCTANWRWVESSFGWSMECGQLAEDTRQFLKFLNCDPVIRAFAVREPGQWAEFNAILTRLSWSTYLGRWNSIYKEQLPLREWIKAGFALPFIPEYYWSVQGAFRYRLMRGFISQAKRLLLA